ncbi:MAG: LysM peptidoglycan-binding domain-containing protein, partial [Clostridiales bacterium]|nr:LysM peptidoglycan-binding domain-containing protein [Clostridiales bacterium]
AGTLIGLNTAESADIPEYIEVYVESGDTLWGLAQTHGPKNVDKRKIIYEVSKINNLSGDYIYPGEVLKFPVYE